MARKSLFSILVRAPWWMSVLAAVPMFAAVQVFLPPIAAFFATLPFLVIASIAAWRQLRAPSTTNVAEILGKVRAMSWDNFSAVVAEALRRDGYAVTAADGSAADFEAIKGGRLALVSCKRWKVAQTGVGPLRDLREAKKARDAQDCIYVSAGDFTANARDYAAKNSVRLLYDAELAQMVARVGHGTRRWKLF